MGVCFIIAMLFFMLEIFNLKTFNNIFFSKLIPFPTGFPYEIRAVGSVRYNSVTLRNVANHHASNI